MASIHKVSIDSNIYNLFEGLSLGVNPDDNLLYIYLDDDPIGDGIDIGGSTGTRYAIAWDLSAVASSTNRTTISEGSPLSATLTATTGYSIDDASVVITMGSADITQSAYSNGTISITSVTGDVSITASATKDKIDLLNVTWANHAITCGQDTNNYNAWSPHNLQYDDIHDCFVFLQCHANRHLNGTFTNWTLSVVNPYDSTDYTNITIPTYIGLGMLFVENGTWTLLPRGGSAIYQSDDMGANWTTIQASVPSYIFGVYKCGNTYFAGNDSNNEITYYKSSDLITWETVSFDSSLGYSILCETTFCEYDGKYWAFNRTNDSTLGHPVILQSADEGDTWTLFSDSMLHGYRSTVSCYPFANYIVVADIDRDNGYLYYNKFDGTAFTELNSWKIPFGGDDFHNVNIASNYEDTVILEFMHACPFSSYIPNGYNEHYTCDNVMLVGSTGSLPSLNFSDFIDTQADFLTYANANLNTGVQNNSYTWTYRSGSSLLINDIGTSFVDEIEVPLNLMQLANTSASAVFYFMNEDDCVWIWNNNVNQANPATGLVSARMGFVTINNNRYVYMSKRVDELPILFRVNYLTLATFSPSSSQNNITGQAWQEDLGFRKAIPININNNNSYIGPVPNGIFNDTTWPHKFAFISYTPVAS